MYEPTCKTCSFVHFFFMFEYYIPSYSMVCISRILHILSSEETVNYRCKRKRLLLSLPHCICQLSLDVHCFSRFPSLNTQQVRAPVARGEQVMVCGEAAFLGSWKMDKALPLYTTPNDYPVWNTKVLCSI